MANVGEQMANAVDAEIASFRSLQEEIQKLHTDQQLLMQQQSENEMVKQELELISESDSSNSPVYKLVGPVLMKNELGDAKQTVEQRLELITGELKKVQNSIKDKEEAGRSKAKKIQEMQGAMQKAAFEAAKSVAAAQQS